MATHTPLRQISTFFKLYYLNPSKALEGEIVKIYTPLVRKIAWTYVKKYNSLEVDDVISVGYEGLLTALRSNTATNSKQFSRYASFKIQGAIVDYLRKNYSFTSRESYTRVKKYKEALANGMDEAAIQKELGLTDTQFRHTKEQSVFSVCSFEVFTDQNQDLESLEDTPEDIIKRKFELSWLRNVVRTLPEREKQILRYRYWNQYSMKEISNLMGLSEARVSQIHKKTLQKLRKEENN